MAFPTSMAALAQRVGCSRYPQRWDDLYSGYLSDLKKSGNPYTDPEFYADLHQQYQILPNYLSLYQEAALAISRDADLSVFLYILCRALQDRQHHRDDMAAFSPPSREDDFACNMLCALAAASEAPMCYHLLTARNLPKTVVDHIMAAPEFGITFYKLRHNGIPGYNLLDWYQLAIDGKLFRIGRLEFEIFATFHGRACVFQNNCGKHIALAHELSLHASGIALGSAGCENEDGSWTAQITETDDAWIGYPVNTDGTVAQNQICLQKDNWKKVLSYGDPVVSVHIPSGGGLTEAAVDQSIADAKGFLAEYFPDYAFRAFVCYSWLMDPQLIGLLGPDCNIAKFNLRFSKLTLKSKGEAVFGFVFLKPNADFDLHTLPERTTLERTLKQHYLSGKYIYELAGYFF